MGESSMKRETVLPKNVRQIGEIQQDKKIYLEDYVMTFLGKKEKEQEKEQEKAGGGKNCAGVLVGSREQDGEAELLFVTGALLMNISEDQEVYWKNMEKEQEQYFPGTNLLGCFVIGLMEEKGIQEMMEQFQDPPALIFHVQDGEEQVYWWTKTQYRRLEGFFVFYERNPGMQKYMSAHCEEKRVEKEQEIPDQAIVKFRKKIKEKGQRARGGFGYLAGSFLVLTVLALGVTIINNYDKMRKIEEAMSRLTLEQRIRESAETAAQTGNAVQDSPSNETVGVQAADQEEKNGNVSAGSDRSGQTDDSVTEAGKTTAEIEKEAQAEGTAAALTASENTLVQDDRKENETGAEEQTESGADRLTDNAAAKSGADDVLADFEHTLEQQALQERSYSAESPSDISEGKTDEVLAASGRASRAVYTIRYGDTLADISQKYYGNLNMVEEICRLNQISDANLIVPGEKIVLP